MRLDVALRRPELSAVARDGVRLDHIELGLPIQLEDPTDVGGLVNLLRFRLMRDIRNARSRPPSDASFVKWLA